MAKNKGNKWERNLDEYEERSGGYDGEKPKPGMYEGILVAFEEHTTSDTALHWVFEITEEGDYTGWRGHMYSDLANAAWKTDMIAVAIRGGEKGKFDVNPDNAEKIIKAAKPVMLVIRRGEYDGEYSPNLARVIPASEASSGGSDSPGKAEKGSKKKKGKKDDPWETPADG